MYGIACKNIKYIEDDKLLFKIIHRLIQGNGYSMDVRNLAIINDENTLPAPQNHLAKVVESTVKEL